MGTVDLVSLHAQIERWADVHHHEGIGVTGCG